MSAVCTTSVGLCLPPSELLFLKRRKRERFWFWKVKERSRSYIVVISFRVWYTLNSR